MKLKRSTSLVLALIMVLVMALTMIACGGDDVTTVTTTTTSTTKATTTTTSTSKQNAGQNPIVIPKPPKDFEGEGTEEDPYIIDSKETLLKLVEKSQEGKDYGGMYFKQTADIVLNDTSVAEWYAAEDAQQWGVIKAFGGIYDGDGHIIEGLLIDKEWNQPYAEMMLGFIGSAQNCTVKNLGFKGMRIVVTYGDGATGTVSDGSIGGIVAYGKGATAAIENCMVDCYINALGSDPAAPKNPSGGALFGYLGAGITVRNCIITGEVNTNHGVIGSGGAGSCEIIGVVSAVDSDSTRVGDWSAGVNCQNVYIREDGPDFGGTAWNFDESCTKVAIDDMLGDGAKTACPGLDFEEVWQANDGKLPSLKVFGNKLIFDAPAVAAPETPAE